MKLDPSNLHGVNDDYKASADAQGLADLEEGRVVSGEAVKRWLRSWGTADRLPIPRIGD